MASGKKPPLLERVRQTQLGRSVLRHRFEDTPRNRALTVMSNVFLHLHPVTVPKAQARIRYTFCLGGLSFFFFLVLTLTGGLLMFYYVPDVSRAYDDMKDLEFAVPFGVFLRNAHRWTAHAMVLSVMLHMLRVLLTGSYKPPREFNWVLGVGLLVLTLLLSFTGYLLPWDQLAYWAVTVGANMGKATPFLGQAGPFHEILGVNERNDVAFVLTGGTMIGQNALTRFYVLHCVVLPLVAAFLAAAHFWRVRKDGGISRPL